MSYWKRFSGIALSLMLLFGVAACSVEQEEEGNMPEYEVTKTEEGNMPEYDVEAGDVEVGTEEKTVTVPDVDIQSPEEDAAEDAAEEEAERQAEEDDGDGY